MAKVQHEWTVKADGFEGEAVRFLMSSGWLTYEFPESERFATELAGRRALWRAARLLDDMGLTGQLFLVRDYGLEHEVAGEPIHVTN